MDSQSIEHYFNKFIYQTLKEKFDSNIIVKLERKDNGIIPLVEFYYKDHTKEINGLKIIIFWVEFYDMLYDFKYEIVNKL